ncbi:MAG: hypothetical protein J07HX64_00190 [halophilic archaeon J07HX64]|nr:MAG: hypothetical protein J07HX64_00190 [halophilic archaeon J07HX64]
MSVGSGHTATTAPGEIVVAEELRDGVDLLTDETGVGYVCDERLYAWLRVLHSPGTG